jgi:hypothetical protein
MDEINSRNNQQQTQPDSQPNASTRPAENDPIRDSSDTNKNDDTANTKNNLSHNSRSGEIIMVIATIVIAISTTIYTIYARQQLKVMSNTLAEMKQSGNETKTQTDRMITETNRIANATTKTVEQSKTALDATIENFRLEQRAWVGTLEVFPAQYEDKGRKVYVKEGQQIRGGVFIMNTGKTPARKLYSLVSMQRLKSGVEPFPKYKVVRQQQPTVTTSIPTHGVMQPGMKFALNPLPIEGNVSKADIDDLVSGKYVVYITGMITYEDIFDRSHKTMFCMYLKPDLATFSACSTGNEAN